LTDITGEEDPALAAERLTLPVEGYLSGEKAREQQKNQPSHLTSSVSSEEIVTHWVVRLGSGGEADGASVAHIMNALNLNDIVEEDNSYTA